jgi:hypothetical protein
LAAIVIFVLAAGALIAGNARFSEVDSRPHVVVDAEYTGEATLRKAPDRLSLMHTLSIRAATLHAAAAAAARRPRLYRRARASRVGFARTLETDIAKALVAHGWTQASPSTDGIMFTRRSVHAVRVPALKAQTTETFEVPHMRLETAPPSRYFIELSSAETSTFVVTAEKAAIGDTFPTGDKQGHPANDDRETTVLPKPRGSLRWELSVRRDLFREEPFLRIANFSVGKTAIMLLMTLLALCGAIAKDEVKVRLKRAIARILKRPVASQPDGAT